MLRESIQKIDLNPNLNFEILKININLKEISKFNISFSTPSSITKDLTKISFKSLRKSIFINDFYTFIRENKLSKSIYSLIEIKKRTRSICKI